MQASEKDLLTFDAISEEKGWPIGTIRYWHQRDEFCQSVKIGRRRYVRRGDLEQWIAAKFDAQVPA